MPKINFSQIKDFAPVDPGTYHSTFTEFKYNPSSKASGEPFYLCTFVCDGETIEWGQVPDVAGRKQFINLSMQPNSLWRFKQFAAELGYDPDLLEADQDFDTDEVLQDLVGQEAWLAVDVQEYQGKPRNTVTGIVQPDYGADPESLAEPVASGRKGK